MYTLFTRRHMKMYSHEAPNLQARDKGLGEAVCCGWKHAAPTRPDARRHRADGHDVDEPGRQARAAHTQITSGACGARQCSDVVAIENVLHIRLCQICSTLNNHDSNSQICP